jgi:transcriptional regulator with XRE-family HTH domain
MQQPAINPLGAYLRARREQLQPVDFGLPAGQRRRTPGLRREEVAHLCDISATWLTWIEQGRTVAVSVPTLAALARGLKLTRAERQYLFQLAGRPDPAATQGATATPALKPLVDAIASPAYVLDRHWEAVAWNRAAGELFTPWLRSGEANLLRFVFLHESARGFIVDWPDRARRLVAEFRADIAAWQNDPVSALLVEELSARSREFALAWDAQTVLARDGGRRGFDHPRRGRCNYEQYTLRVAQQPDFKLTVLVTL